MIEPQVYKIKTWIEGDDIHQETFDPTTKQFQRKIIRTQEEQIKKALIELGWWSPEMVENFDREWYNR